MDLETVLDLHTTLTQEPPRTPRVTKGRSGRPVALPTPDLHLPVGLTDSLWRRRSRHAFAGRPLEPQLLSTLLRLAVGVGRRENAYGQQDYPFRLAPSAAGLHSITTYVIAAPAGPCKDAPPGAYFYEPLEHELRPVVTDDPTDRLREIFLQGDVADAAPVTLALVAHLDTMLVKFPARHYRTMHVDGGLAAQNLYLLAEALGLAGCAVASFAEGQLADLLCLPRTSIPILLFPIGHRVT